MIRSFFVLLLLYQISSACLYNEIHHNLCLVSLSFEERNHSLHYIQGNQTPHQNSISTLMYFEQESLPLYP